MKTKFFVAAAAAVALIACAKNEESVVQPSVDETGVLKVRMNSGQTKITESGGDEEKSVSDYQILIYDMNSRMLEAYARPEADSDEISVNCRVGTKEVIVLANAPDVQDVFSYDEFMRERSDLADNAIGELVMEGLKDVDDVAYVRYASVHRQFKDINTLLNEIEELVKLKDSLASYEQKKKNTKPE